MTYQPHQFVTPEIILADRIFGRLPRVGSITEKELKEVTDSHQQNEKATFEQYFSDTLDSLIREGYINRQTGVGIGSNSNKYSLTSAGRDIKDAGGYSIAKKRKQEKENQQEKIKTAEGQKKIFDNNVKIFIFIIAIIGGIIGILNILEKIMPKPPVSTGQAIATKIKDTVTATSPIITPKKIKQPVTKQPQKQNTQVAATPVENKPIENTQPTLPAPKPLITNYPAQVTVSDNIEFKLTKAEGNSKAQTITITMVLTTSAANWYIMSSVRSIIDPEGNEYTLKSYTLGATNYGGKIELNTGIPIKCTYTFGGVLPDVKTIKLFKYSYTHSWGEPFSVEFRDVPVLWR